MRPVLYPTILLLACHISLAQDGDFRLGARTSGLGGVSTTLEDGWALNNNIAGIGRLDHSMAMLSYQNRFNVSSFQVIGGGYVQRMGFGNAGVSFYKFGDDLYSQQKMTIGYANHIDMVSLGIAASIVQVSIEGLGTESAVVIEFGGMADITKQLKFGAHVFNLNQADLAEDIPVSTVIKAGIAYLPIEQLSLSLEVQKDLEFDEIVRIGLEYEVIKNVWLRTGISTNPFKSAFGAGFLWRNFTLDYAFNDQSDLGVIHEFSLGYLIGKKN